MQKIFAGVGAPIRRNEDIHFPEPLIRYGSLWGGSRVGAASFCRRDRAHAGVSQPSGLKAISPNKPSPAKFLPLGEGLQMHYVEAQYRRLKGCIGERFLRPFEWFKRPTWGDRQRTNPSQNIATTDLIQPAVLETVSGGTNAGSARDRRAGPAHRRRSIQIRI
jgi:hypothetical protein